jgi:hypothetical protein
MHTLIIVDDIVTVVNISVSINSKFVGANK